ncbi:hypothetical protein GJ496_001057 [Pomphorhynchus laevis]|nr:hypothetical protein GJ496_001057 [Pomphorhynchus laevis]
MSVYEKHVPALTKRCPETINLNQLMIQDNDIRILERIVLEDGKESLANRRSNLNELQHSVLNLQRTITRRRKKKSRRQDNRLSNRMHTLRNGPKVYILEYLAFIDIHGAMIDKLIQANQAETKCKDAIIIQDRRNSLVCVCTDNTIKTLLKRNTTIMFKVSLKNDKFFKFWMFGDNVCCKPTQRNNSTTIIEFKYVFAAMHEVIAFKDNLDIKTNYKYHHCDKMNKALEPNTMFYTLLILSSIARISSISNLNKRYLSDARNALMMVMGKLHTESLLYGEILRHQSKFDAFGGKLHVRFEVKRHDNDVYVAEAFLIKDPSTTDWGKSKIILTGI